MYVNLSAGACGIQKRASDPHLELELQAFVSCLS